MNEELLRQLRDVTDGKIRDPDECREVLRLANTAYSVHADTTRLIENLVGRATEAFIDGWPTAIERVA